MKMTWDHSKENDTRQLVILLPGIWDKPAEFKTHGFIEIARKNDIEHDFLSVDANIAYLVRGNFSQRFMEDVIIPARKKGYQSFWLIGISLGGYNALSYYLDQPETIEGVVLLSPYVGVNKEEDFLHQIRQFIDSENLSSVSERVPYTNWERLAAFKKRSSLKNIYLAYGRQDGFASRYSEFERLLPSENIHAIDGNHDWRTWSRLWEELLQMGMIKPLQSATTQTP
ncbi:MAG: alpha/beta hydrolase [Thiohalophilus sp.]|uniref:alpha/beta hydrolase n=1 Tax=Thiohalophilus sp. TaxID=3028392 RepID=UPI00286FE3E8|nr:alpha/beta hydrolase [Thiohalophilus sp.]MDR9435522.1 alpha/beta hydrolase [Thiohalophilus sp.]